MEERRFFICFEGIPGSGKSTQAVLLKQRIEKEGLGKVIISKAYENKRKQAVDWLIEYLKITPYSISTVFLFQALRAEQYKETNSFKRRI